MIATINIKHLKEWTEGSGVSEDIARLAIRSLEDYDEIARVLNQKKWGRGIGCLITGVDPATGQPTMLGAQFKPDVALDYGETKRDGTKKLVKYLGAKDARAAGLFLAMPDPEYWLKVINDASISLWITEGAKKAGCLLTRDRAAISIPGVCNAQKKEELNPEIAQFCQPGRTVVLCFDADSHTNPNVFKALDKTGRLIAAKGAVVQIVEWDISLGKGIDDYIVNGGSLDDLEPLSYPQWRDKYMPAKDKEALDKQPKDNAPVKKTLYQEVLEQLFRKDGEHWICVRGELYQWQENHYCKIPDEDIVSVISNYCDQYKVWRFTKEDGGYWEYPYATPGYVEKSLKWAKMRLAVAPERCNPAGINCTNGVLKISWYEENERPRPKWNLEPHDPKKHFYLYQPLVDYRPIADMTHVQKLQACLNPAEWDIFIKTIGASLDLEAVLKVTNRMKALLLFGEGENGKDTLKDVVSLMYGNFGITGCTFSDFLQYDKGRKFPLSKLEHARVNWSSENTSFVSIDDLQSLKQIITGEKIDIEGKSKDERSEKIKCVNLFNFNIAPKLLGNINAIGSRYTVLRFEKVFKKNANPRLGEMEADPRFKYDQNFVVQNVLPAFLNLALDGLYRLMSEGINYDACQEAMDEIQMSNSHLQRFCREVGLVYDPEGVTYPGEIWDRLEDWYREEGVLETDANGKKIWHDQPKSFDRNVTASNMVRARFLELFPKARTGKKDTTGKAPILGLKFVDPATIPTDRLRNLSQTTENLSQILGSPDQNLSQRQNPETGSSNGLEANSSYPSYPDTGNGHHKTEIEKNHTALATIPTGSNGHSVQNGYAGNGQNPSIAANGTKNSAEILNSEYASDFVEICSGGSENGGQNRAETLATYSAEPDRENAPAGSDYAPARLRNLSQLPKIDPQTGSAQPQKTLLERWEAVAEECKLKAPDKLAQFKRTVDKDNEGMITMAERWAKGGFRSV